MTHELPFHVQDLSDLLFDALVRDFSTVHKARKVTNSRLDPITSLAVDFWGTLTREDIKDVQKAYNAAYQRWGKVAGKSDTVQRALITAYWEYEGSTDLQENIPIHIAEYATTLLRELKKSADDAPDDSGWASLYALTGKVDGSASGTVTIDLVRDASMVVFGADECCGCELLKFNAGYYNEYHIISGTLNDQEANLAVCKDCIEGRCSFLKPFI